MEYLQWVPTLLLLSVLTVHSTKYSQQIVAIVDNSKQVKEAAKYLFNKHPLSSQVVKWLPKDPTNPSKGNEFKLMEWDPTAGGGAGDFIEQTTGTPPTSKAIQALPHSGRLQVVGHGRIDATTKKITMGGMDALQLSAALKTLPNSGTTGAVKRVSLVGCSLGELNDKGTDFVGDRFAEDLLKDMKNTVEEVSSRNGIVGVDSSGRKVYGELTKGGTIWRPKEGAITKTVINLDSKGKVQRIEEKIGHDTAKYQSPTALSRAFKPIGGSMELEELTATGGAVNPEFVTLSNDDLFSIITSVKDKVFQGVTVDANWDTKVTKERLVRVYDKKTKKTKEITRKVREFTSYEAVTKEIKHWGEPGFEFPQMDRKTKTFSTTDSSGAPFSNKYIYYRYGDFVYSLHVQSDLQLKGPPFGLNPFYTALEGVIVNEDPTDPAGPIKNTGLDLSKYSFGDQYKIMQPLTDNNFFSDARKWMGGEHAQIGTTKTNAINGETAIAMFMCEAMRDFRIHVTNKLSLDLNAHVAMFDRNVYYEGHPIGRGEAGPAREHGDRDGYYVGRNGKPKTNFKVKAIMHLYGALLQQYGEGGFSDTTRNCRKRPASSTTSKTIDNTKRLRIIDDFKDSLEEVMASDHYTGSKFIETNRVIAGPLFDGPYDAREVEEPQTESVQSEVSEYHGAEDLSLPVRLSQALLIDQLYISKKIAEDVKAQQIADGKVYRLVDNSMNPDYFRNFKVKYSIWEPSERSSGEVVHMETDIDESQITSKNLLDEMHNQAQSLPEKEGTGMTNKGLAIYGTVMGVKGTLEAFERGDVWHGTINLAQTLHGICEMSWVDRQIYEGSGRVMANLAREKVEQIGETVGHVVSEDAGRLIAGEESEILSAIGKPGRVARQVPVVGTVFGFYNIYEDLKQHSPIGYVDAGLDTFLTVLGIFAPEAEPLAIALTIIRLGIDTFYTDIKKELEALPSYASGGEKFLAVLEGIAEGVFDMIDSFTGNMLSIPFRVHKLENEYEKNQEFLRKMSDYHNYFKVIKCDGNPVTVNFAEGQFSWNGGNIVFHLAEGGMGGELIMTSILEDGRERRHFHDVRFEVPVTDIVMGIGESNKVSYHKESVKVFWVIPVDEKKIISGLQGDRRTLHGEYFGNSDNNNFFAIQNLPSNQPFELTDYHYVLIGNGGNDSFYLGPQYTYVEGNDGADTYYLDGDSTHVRIYNHDSHGTVDYMIIPKEIHDLSLASEGNDAVIRSGSNFIVYLDSWHSGPDYQHLVFKSSEHVLFRIEDGLVPYAISGVGSEGPVSFNVNYLGFPTISQLIGSDYDDSLYGYNNDDVLIPGKGSDRMGGRDGADTYVIENTEGNDEITNYADDNKMDTVAFPAVAESISAQRSTVDHHDLVIQSQSYELTIHRWFYSDSFQHIMLHSVDGFFLEIRHDTTTDIVNLIPTVKEMVPGEYSVDLRNSPFLKQVTSVVATEDAQGITGNDLDNYISVGSGHSSVIVSGREGSDTYIVKESRSSMTRRRRNNDYKGIIYNRALDLKTDVLLYDADYNDIRLSVDNNNLILATASSSELDVLLMNWFTEPTYQHLIIRSRDGISFTPPLTISDTIIHNPMLGITVLMIDNSKSPTDTRVSLIDTIFLQVERVMGSPHFDIILGNPQDNYIDPREGGSSMVGNNGSDTYVLKPGYGTNNLINNIASDNASDSVLFGANYDDITIEPDPQSSTLVYTDPSNSANSFSVVLFFYGLKANARHLTITSSDGITFILTPDRENEFFTTKVPIAINKADKNPEGQSQQEVHLSGTDKFEEVRTVYGFKSQANNITGNDKPNTIVGGDDDDYIHGGGGNDVLKGGAGSNTIIGGPGNDTLNGGTGNDYLEGGPDNDIISPGAGDNFIDGGDGDDTILYAGDPVNEVGIYIDLNNGISQHSYGHDEIHGIENIYASPYDDTLIGSALDDNVLNGREGDDTFIAYDGYDILIGGKGSDTYNLLEASGTKVIVNEADDGLLDTVDLSFIESDKLRYERQGDSLIVRIASKFFTNSRGDSFPGCRHLSIPWIINLQLPDESASFCESYSPRHPTLILQNYLAGTAHRHLTLVTADCSLNDRFLSRLPIRVSCNGRTTF